MTRKKSEGPAKTPAESKSSRLRSVFYVLATLVFAGITFAILTIVPRTTVVELEAATPWLSFSLPEVDEAEGLSLLHSSLRTEALSIEEFQPVELNIISFENEKRPRGFKNPLTVSPISPNARITFRSPQPDISFQELFCFSGSRVSFQKDDEGLKIAIRNRQAQPYAALSLGELLSISLRDCQVKDAEAQNFDRIFDNPVQLRLHEISRSLHIVGRDEGLATSAALKDEVEASLQLMFKQPVSSVDFFKTVISPGNTSRQSALERLAVQRNFPLESVEFKSRGAGDLEVRPEPDDFVLYDLSVTGAGLQARLGAKLTSLKVSQGAISTELVPGFLSFVTKNPATSILITWLGWILTIFIPLFTKLFSNKS